MTTLAELFATDKSDIDVRVLDGATRVSAWLLGALAVHQGLQRNGLYSLDYVITHVPSGIHLGPLFDNREAAGRALLAVRPLFDWSGDPRRMPRELKAAISRLLAENGGRFEDGPEHEFCRERGLKEFAGDLNGYGDEK